jgi:hypothetical protein
MLTLYYTPGACSMAAHIVLEESDEHYEAKKVDLAGGDVARCAGANVCGRDPLGSGREQGKRSLPFDADAPTDAR